MFRPRIPPVLRHRPLRAERCALVFSKALLSETMEPIEVEMAERFFKKEVQKLYLGAGQEFRGEGILAVTKTLLTELNLRPGGSL